MNARILAALAQAGRPAVDVTARMEALLGPIPAACRTAAPPEPSGTVALEVATDGGQTWTETATFPAVPASLCLRLRTDVTVSTRLCLDQPAPGRRR
jgi:hypothetical protein